MEDMEALERQIEKVLEPLSPEQRLEILIGLILERLDRIEERLNALEFRVVG